MLKLIYRLMFVLGLSFFNTCAKKGKNVLIVGTSADFPPFEYFENNKIIGLDVELIRSIAEKLGMDIVFENMEFSTLLMALASGKIDVVVAGMTITEERKKQINFTDGYMESKQVLIVRNMNNNLKTLDDLNGKKIGVQLGTTGDLFVSGLKDVENIKFDSGVMAVIDLKNNKIDAIMIDAEPAKKILANNRDIKIYELTVARELYGIAVQKHNKELLEKLNKTINEMKKSGELRKIISKYFSNENKISP